eukprot:1137346-Pelagomonas_calceolata.AAC.4
MSQINNRSASRCASLFAPHLEGGPAGPVRGCLDGGMPEVPASACARLRSLMDGAPSAGRRGGEASGLSWRAAVRLLGGDASGLSWRALGRLGGEASGLSWRAAVCLLGGDASGLSWRALGRLGGEASGLS